MKTFTHAANCKGCGISLGIDDFDIEMKRFTCPSCESHEVEKPRVPKPKKRSSVTTYADIVDGDESKITEPFSWVPTETISEELLAHYEFPRE